MTQNFNLFQKEINLFVSMFNNLDSNLSWSYGGTFSKIDVYHL